LGKLIVTCVIQWQLLNLNIILDSDNPESTISSDDFQTPLKPVLKTQVSVNSLPTLVRNKECRTNTTFISFQPVPGPIADDDESDFIFAREFLGKDLDNPAGGNIQSISLVSDNILHDGEVKLRKLLYAIAIGYQHIAQYRCREAISALQQLPKHQYETGWILTLIAKAHLELVEYPQVC
jgi:hypothetical protein